MIVILGLFAPVSWPVRAADMHCGPPIDWQKLTALSHRHFRQPDRIDTETTRDIAAAMRDINWPRLYAWQGQTGRADVPQMMNDSVETLRDFASTGILTQPRSLLKQLRQIEKLSDDICVDLAMLRPSEDSGITESRPSPAGFGMSPEGERLADYVRLSILPVIVASFAVILKVLHIALKWSHTRRYSRRSCKVKADLHIGRYIIPGTITVLGLHGCRLVPDDDEARALLAVVAESGETQLLVGSIRIPANVVALHDNWSAILFQMALDERLHATILERSEIRARAVTLPGLRHNVARRDTDGVAPARVLDQVTDQDVA